MPPVDAKDGNSLAFEALKIADAVGIAVTLGRFQIALELRKWGLPESHLTHEHFWSPPSDEFVEVDRTSGRGYSGKLVRRGEWRWVATQGNGPHFVREIREQVPETREWVVPWLHSHERCKSQEWCWGNPPQSSWLPRDWNRSLVESRSHISSPATRVALASRALAVVVVTAPPDVELALLDAAVLLGHAEAAKVLSRAYGSFKPMRVWPFCELFVMEDELLVLNVCEQPMHISDWTGHYRRFHLLDSAMIYAAIQAGVDFGTLQHRNPFGPDLSLNLLDVAILSGEMHIAKALREADVGPSVLSSHEPNLQGALLLGVEENSLCVRESLVLAAVAGGVILDNLRVDMNILTVERVSDSLGHMWGMGEEVELECSLCQSDVTERPGFLRRGAPVTHVPEGQWYMSLLDAAIMLGQKSCACKLVEHGLRSCTLVCDDMTHQVTAGTCECGAAVLVPFLAAPDLRHEVAAEAYELMRRLEIQRCMTRYASAALYTAITSKHRYGLMPMDVARLVAGFAADVPPKLCDLASASVVKRFRL